MATDDYPINGVNTPAHLWVGSWTYGNIEVVGDQDWFRIALQANVTYGFYQIQTPLGQTDGLDSHLYLFSPDGATLLEDDDDSWGARNSYFTYTPSYAGNYLVAALANDWTYLGTYTGGYEVGAFVINRAPVLTGLATNLQPNQAVAASSLFAAQDPDGDTIETYAFYEPAGLGYLTWTGAANWDSVNRVLTISASNLSGVTYFGGAVSGSEALEVSAYDGGLWSPWTLVSVTVQDTNDAPALAWAVGDQYWTEGLSGRLDIPANTFTDADGDALTYTATLANGNPLPSWLIFNPATMRFSGTPPYGAADVVVRLTATDAGGLHAYDDIAFYTPRAAVTPTLAAADIFNAEGSAGSSGPAGVFDAGLVRVMADFAKAAYDLQPGELAVFNDPSPNAGSAKAAVFAQGWVPVALSIPSLPATSPVNGVNVPTIAAGGYYTIGNAAAFVARSADAIVISFRGTNDNATPWSPNANAVDPWNDIHPDADQWGAPLSPGDMADHYALFAKLIEALDAYVESDTTIEDVYVTGHSMGGAMAIRYMHEHKGDPMYRAVTFAAPSFTGSGLIYYGDARITQIEIAEDPVPATWAAENRPGQQVLFAGDQTLDEPDWDVSFVNEDNHSMDYYRQITDSVDAEGWRAILDYPGDVSVLISAASGPWQTPTRHDPPQQGDQFDTFFIVDGRASGKWPSGDTGVDREVNDGSGTLTDPWFSDYDILYGGRGNDWIEGGTDAELLLGGPGDDVLWGHLGSDTLDGGQGTDTAVYTSPLSQYVISSASGVINISHKLPGDGTDTLREIEVLSFDDHTIDLAVTAAAASVSPGVLQSIVELYVAFFNRVPDSSGMTYWLGQAAAGMPVTSIANSFYAAAVYYSSYTGYSQDMSNAQFVSVIYKNVLGRSSVDEGGLAYWTGALASGAESRGTLVATILGSAHTFKGNAEYGYVADLLDNKFMVGKLFAIDMGLSFNTSEESISEGMLIAAAVTPTDTAAAIALIGVDPSDVDLG